MNEPDVTSHDNVNRLLSAFLDDVLSAEDAERLDRLVATDPAVAAALARAAMLHDRLHDVLRPQATTARGSAVQPAVDRLQGRLTRARRYAGIAIAMAAAAGLVVLMNRVPTATAAVVALDRIVAAIEAPIDRGYRITVLDHGPTDRTPPAAPGGGRKPGIDGARLFVRGADQFVLVRRFGDGSEFITGSDGVIGWAVPPRGRVHLSHDTRRFRRGVPGEHEELPFLDLRSGLESLRHGYDLGVSTDASSGQRLEAVRRESRRRGPHTVRIWFDHQGVATRIEIEGLAVQDGLPRAVALELVSREPLTGEFFGHAAHHTPDRPTDWE